MPPTITGHEMRVFGSGNPQKPRFRRERPHPRPAVPFINLWRRKLAQHPIEERRASQ
jgi:hypothetical protein